MTRSDLQDWRKRVPFFIFGICVLPWFLFRSVTHEDVKFFYEILAPAIALIAAFFYVGLDIRGDRWSREVETLGLQDSYPRPEDFAYAHRPAEGSGVTGCPKHSGGELNVQSAARDE